MALKIAIDVELNPHPAVAAAGIANSSAAAASFVRASASVVRGVNFELGVGSWKLEVGSWKLGAEMSTVRRTVRIAEPSEQRSGMSRSAGRCVRGRDEHRPVNGANRRAQ